MATVRTETFDDVPEILETLSTTTSMIEAMSTLLEYAHRSGDDLSHYGCGIERIFSQQCEDLKFLEGALRQKYAAMETSKIAVRDLEQVALWSGVSPKVAARVISIATGVRLPEIDDDAYDDLVETTQQVSIIRAMQSKADIEAISSATAVPADTVMRVLDEAYLYNPRRMAAIRERREQALEQQGAAYVGA